MEGKLRTDLTDREFYFYKTTWKEGTSIYFGLNEGRIYYAIKTKEALLGNAKPDTHLIELFTDGIDLYNPYGREDIYLNDWLTSTSIWVEMADGSFAKEYIIPKVKRVLEYLNNHPELERKMKG